MPKTPRVRPQYGGKVRRYKITSAEFAAIGGKPGSKKHDYAVLCQLYRKAALANPEAFHRRKVLYVDSHWWEMSDGGTEVDGFFEILPDGFPILESILRTAENNALR